MNKEYLKKFSTEVSKEGEIYNVTYSHGSITGECRYVEMRMTGSTKPIRQEMLLLTHCEMKDIIGEIDNDYKLSEEDFTSISLTIREDSLNKVTEYKRLIS